MKSSQVAGHSSPPDRQSAVMVRALFALAVAITVSGALFAGYSILAGASFRVFNAPLPGALFGLMVVYFGVRGILSVRRLREDVYERGARFSWSNFRKKR